MVKFILIYVVFVFFMVSCTNKVESIDSEVKKGVAVSKVIGVDIRRPEELIENPAPGSVHIEMGEVADRFEKEFPKKDAEISLFCEAGGRAQRVKEFLESKGYTNIKNIGSWREWNASQK